ncbi:hypothetical protein U9M48_031107, partial [Paspalum notatum var. saurae]
SLREFDVHEPEANISQRSNSFLSTRTLSDNYQRNRIRKEKHAAPELLLAASYSRSYFDAARPPLSSRGPSSVQYSPGPRLPVAPNLLDSSSRPGAASRTHGGGRRRAAGRRSHSPPRFCSSSSSSPVLPSSCRARAAGVHGMVVMATAVRWPGGGTAARARQPATWPPHRIAAEPEQKAATVRLLSWMKPIRHDVRAQMSNINVGAGSYEGNGASSHGEHLDKSATRDSNKQTKPLSGSHNLQSVGAVLLLCTLATGFLVFFKGQTSAVVDMLAKSGFTAAFALIFVSEIGDKTFFIAALLAMQYQRALVLLGSMAALSLMTIVSVIIGRIFQSVPAQFQTTLPIGEYAAVALLAFFGFKSIKDALALPDNANGNPQGNSESGELAEAEELVKEKVSKKLTSPLEVLWKSFSLVFFAEWGDRSMLATIALGAAQSPFGVASGAIAGHLIATALAILGGAFLAKYLSEKLVGMLGGVLFLLFAAATLFGVF